MGGETQWTRDVTMKQIQGLHHLLYTFVSFRSSEVKGLTARTTWDMGRLRLATGSLWASVL